MADRDLTVDNAASTSIVVHDCSGHPFQMQLSRWFAAEGYSTVHLHCPAVQTPKGAVSARPGDPASLEIVAIAMRHSFEKYALVRRVAHELEYGWRLARAVSRRQPDIVISSNSPLLAAALFQFVMRVRGTPVVFWQQDVYSIGMTDHLARRFGWIGRALGRLITRIEAWVARSSAWAVIISGDFAPLLRSWGVDPDRLTVIQNWAPLDEIVTRPRVNDFALDHDLDEAFVFLYAGTLGLKHDPSLLLALAEHFSDRSDVKVVVASEGRGARWLTQHGSHLPGLVQIPYQPYESLPDMLAASDVLVVILESDAGVFSVPSKVLTYHCIGRPLLAAVPSSNLAARIITGEASGICVDPDDADALLAAAERLEADSGLRESMGAHARAYAERTFDINLIGAEFSAIIEQCLDRPPGSIRRSGSTAADI